MLQSLNIQNLVTIDNLTIKFNSGMSVVTGDSGAGKSIILSAISLALGSRADKTLIKPNQKKAYIIADFSINNKNIANFLAINDLGSDCILRRVIGQNSSKSFINDIPVSNNLLQKLSVLLIDISSQNAHQLLLKDLHQLQIIDDYANNIIIRNKVKNSAILINELNKKIIIINASSTKNKDRFEFLTFQIKELDEASLTQEELENIEEKHKILNNLQALIDNLSTVNDLLSNSNFIDKSISLLNDSIKIDTKLSSTLEMLESAKINITESSYEINNYLSLCDISSEMIFNINQRLSFLNDLSRKHNCQIIELIDKKNILEQEINSINNADVNIENLYQQQQEQELLYKKLTTDLSLTRVNSVKKINILISKNIIELGMNGAKFNANLIKKEGVNKFGNEAVEFLIQTNAGSNFKNLKKTASGGELSRISLAISVVTSSSVYCPTLVFDEVDVGISGNAASVVGAKLKQLSKTYQVICITHLPQVASFADKHLLVNKKQQDNHTTTLASYLNKNKRIAEIARILSGDNISDKTLALAKEMIENNG